MRPNIIFLLNSPYPDYTGGRETWVNNVCNCMIENYNITIVSQKNDWNTHQGGTFDNIDQRIKIVRASTISSYPFICKFVHSYVGFLNKFILARNMWKKAEEAIEPNEEYAVISMDTVFMAYAGRKLCRKRNNLRHIASSRGPHAEVYAFNYPFLKPLIMYMERKNLERANCIWANGYDTYRSIMRKGFMSTVIKNGVNIEKADTSKALDLKALYKIDKEEKILVTIGTLEDVKGYKQAILALSKLKYNYGIRAHLFGVGKGKPETYMKFAEGNHVGELVHFVGEHRNTIEYAKAADVVLCLSGGSGLGMACLESMTSKKPIVAWNSSVYTQMLKNHNSGLLVEEWNEDALAEGINYVLRNYSESIRWAEKAYDAVKKYDWKYVVRDIEESLNGLEENK